MYFSIKVLFYRTNILSLYERYTNMKRLFIFALLSVALPLFALRPGDKVGEVKYKLKWIDCTPFKIGELNREDKAVTPPLRALVFLFTRSKSSSRIMNILEDTRKTYRNDLRIAVITPDTEHDAKLFHRKHPDVRVRLAVDSERKITPLFMAGSMLYPMAFVYDADGRILWNGEAVDLPEAVQNILQNKNDIDKQRKISQLLDEMQQRMRTGETRALQQAAEKIFKLDIANASALRMLIFILENSGRHLEAWTVLEKQIKTAPSTLRLYYTAMEMVRRYPDLQKNLSSVINGFYANAATPEQRLFFTETLLYNFPGNITALDSAANELRKNNSGFEKLSPLEKSRLFAAAARLRYLSGDLDGAIKFQQRACDALPKNGDKTTAETFSTQLDFYLKLQIINKKELTL